MNQTPQADGKAIVSLVIGIIGLFTSPFLIGFVFGIIAIVLGNSSERTNGPTGVAKAGKIIGIIDIVLSIVILVVAILMAVVVGVASLGLGAFSF